jgi:hypothetical protein
VRVRLAVLVVGLVLAGFQSARAEVIGPLLPAGAFEAGLQATSIKREVYYGEEEFDWEEGWALIAARWGITEAATLSLEASRDVIDIPDNLTGLVQDAHAAYLVGGALQAALWRNDDITVSAAFQFTMTMMRIDGGPVRNVSTETFGGQVMAQYETELWGSAFTAWGGPAFSKFYPTYEQQIDKPAAAFYTESDWGAVLGLGFLLWNHLDVTGHVLWVENPQPRVGLLYRF